MPRGIAVMLVLVLSLPAVCQSTSQYQLATITNVSIHQPKDDTSMSTSYDVTVKVDNTEYVVRYTPRFGENTVLYSAGRQLLVLVGKDTIRYNDILGQSFEVPILSRKAVEAPAAKPKSPEVSAGNAKAVKGNRRSK